MADQNIDPQLMSIISGKLMLDPKYVKYRYNNKTPSTIYNALKEQEPDEIENLIKEAEEAKKIIDEDNASFSHMMKKSISDIKGTVAAGVTELGNAASNVKGNVSASMANIGSAASDRFKQFSFRSNKDAKDTTGGKRKSRKQKKSKKSKKNKSKKSKK